MRLLLLALFVGAPLLLPQAAPRIAIAAPDAQIVVGETVQFQVVVRDANGNIVSNPTVNWSTPQPNLLRVDPRGAATALGVGLCAISANSAGFVATVQLQCIPARISLQPAFQEINVGDQINFEAKALDVTGNPIPNVNFNWTATGANGGQINAARIDQSGRFNALGSGLITVRARIDVSGGSQAGRVQWIWGAATVRIAPPKTYRLTRLFGSEETRHSFNLGAIARNAVINRNGQAALVGSLDGVAHALVAVDRGLPRVLMQGGSPMLEGISDGPDGISINASGDILTRFEIHPGRVALALFSGGTSRILLLQGQTAAGVENIRIGFIGPYSLNDINQVVFPGSYTLAGSTRSHTALFRLSDRNIEVLASSETPLPGLPGPVVNFEQFGIDNQGLVYFLAAASPAARALYRIALSGQPEQLLPAATGFQSNSFAVAPEGGVAVVATLSARPRLVRIRGAQTTDADGAGVSTLFQSSDSSGILYYACLNDGCGLRRWTQGAPTTLLLTGQAASNGEPVTNFLAASLGLTGVLTVQVATPTAPFLLLQRSASSVSSTLLQTGSRIDADVNIQFPWNNALIRTSPGGPLYFALGNPNSLFALQSGALVPQITQGDILPDGAVFNGSLAGSQSGGVYLHAGGSVYLFKNGRIETLLRSGARLLSGATLLNAVVRASNTRGAAALLANISVPNAPNAQAVVLRDTSGTLTEILRTAAPAPNGAVFSQINSIYLDDAGRIAFTARLNNQAQESYFLYDSGRLENLFPTPRLQLPEMSFTALNLRAGRGPGFFAFANTPGGSDQAVLLYSNGRWNLTVNNQVTMPDGSSNSGISSWDANAAGDVAFVTQSGSPLALTVRTAAGDLRQVFSLLEPTPAGVYIRSIPDIDFRNDGLIYFTAFESNGRYAIYVAEPLL